MSAIGDYVHYSAAGYKQHGITLRGDADDGASVFNNQRQKIIDSQIKQQAFTAAERKELEDAITKLMRPSNNDDIQALDELWEALIKEFEKEFDNDIAGEISRQTANIGYSYKGGVRKIQKSKGGNIRYSTILRRVGQINNYIQKISDGASNKEELINDVENIYQLVSELSGETRANLQATGYNIETKKATGQTTVRGKMYTWDEAESVITAINKLAAKSMGAANLQKGTLFEYIIAVAPLVGQGEALQKLQEFISKVVGTSDRSSVTFDSKDFSAAVDLQKVLGTNYTYDVSDKLYSTTGVHQNKVDVELGFKNKTVGVSAKNINLRAGHDIHLLSGASMLSILANSGNDYANHYLNVVATHGNNALGSVLNLAHESFKISALLMAFEGYRNSLSGKANVFVINDNTTGKVRVYNIADLIVSATSELNSYTVTANGNSVDSIQLRNEWNDDGYPGRITDLLASVHAQKISVALSPNIL